MEFRNWSFLTPELTYRLKSYPILFSLRFLLERVGVLFKEEGLYREINNIAEIFNTFRIRIFLVRIEVNNYNSNYNTIFRSIISYKEF
jgi:hypothetical protein